MKRTKGKADPKKQMKLF
nr:hypothetical protein [Niabella ginsengisoli]